MDNQKLQLLIQPLSDKIGKEIPLPYYATAGAAAVDLHACLDEPMVIPAGELAMVPTGLAVAIPEGCVGILASCVGVLGLGSGLIWHRRRPAAAPQQDTEAVPPQVVATVREELEREVMADETQG